MKYYVKGKRHPTKINVCAECSQKFSPAYTRKDQKFCTRECYSKAHAKRLTKKTCAVCGRGFEVSVAIAHRYTVCSRKCRTEHTVYRACKRCGKAPELKRDPRSPYCSEECYRPPVFKGCGFCGKRFRFVPADDPTYCSFHCYRRSRGESKLETKVRMGLEVLGVGFVQEMAVGRYCADFGLPDMKVVIEADGQYWHKTDRDQRRDALFTRYGWTTIRLSERTITETPRMADLLKDLLAPYWK